MSRKKSNALCLTLSNPARIFSARLRSCDPDVGERPRRTLSAPGENNLRREYNSAAVQRMNQVEDILAAKTSGSRAVPSTRVSPSKGRRKLRARRSTRSVEEQVVRQLSERGTTVAVQTIRAVTNSAFPVDRRSACYLPAFDTRSSSADVAGGRCDRFFPTSYEATRVT